MAKITRSGAAAWVRQQIKKWNPAMGPCPYHPVETPRVHRPIRTADLYR